MPLQLGNWRINSSGYDAGVLFIESIDADGHIKGSLFTIGGSQLAGFWNEVTQELVFSVFTEVSGGHLLRFFYQGYLFASPVVLQPGQDFTWTLAGSFQMLDTSLAPIPNMPTPTARRNRFGWFAQITAIV